MAIDYGKRRVGLAITDLLGITAQGLETLTVCSEKEKLYKVKQIVASLNISEIVISLPKNMNGTEGELAKNVRKFGRELSKRAGFPVKFLDERLTSAAALRVIHQSGERPRNKGDVDKIAAITLLQTYLKRQHCQKQ